MVELLTSIIKRFTGETVEEESKVSQTEFVRVPLSSDTIRENLKIVDQKQTQMKAIKREGYTQLNEVAGKPFEEGKYTFIDTEFNLINFGKWLREINVEAIGVDLENNHLSTYNGFLCLIQLTIPTYDTFLIDAVKLRNSIQSNLGPIFEDSKITKVFHGSLHSDVSWLQRDFGIQVINVFDTQEAEKLLLKGGRNLSLTHLWGKYCSGLSAYSKDDKAKFQTSDWSQRQLPLDMLNYASHDSYFLLYIASCQQKEVLAKENGINELQEFFKDLNDKILEIQYTLREYLFDPTGYRLVFRKILDGYDPQSDSFLLTDYCFKGLYSLRETIAQDIDLNPDTFCDIPMIYLLSKKRPTTADSAFAVIEEQGKHASEIFMTQAIKFIEEINKRIERFPAKKNEIRDSYVNAALPQLQGWNSQQLKKQQKEERKVKLVKAYSCKKAVYENCKMVAPDGQLLSNCDRKKAQWYIERGLADKINDEPLTIQLRFEPNGRGGGEKPHAELYDDKFYVADRENKCVVCGKDKDYSRFHVIPTLYRTHFPDELKSHRAHDIVLLCFTCHERASRKQDQLKMELSEKYGIPMNEHNPNKLINIVIQQLNRSAHTLKKNALTIPEEKVQEIKAHIEAVINENLELIAEMLPKGTLSEDGGISISQDLINFLAKMPLVKLSNKDKQNPHGKAVVDIITRDGLMAEFIKQWRTNFIQNMKPGNLPNGWRVDHTIERSFGSYSKFNKKASEEAKAQE